MKISSESHQQNEYLPERPFPLPLSTEQSETNGHNKTTNNANNFTQKGSITTLASTSSYVEPIAGKDNSIPEYLYLQDSNDDCCYYEEIQYETVDSFKKGKRKIKTLLITTTATFVLLFIATILTITFYWKTSFSTTLKNDQIDYCAGKDNITQQLACRRAFVRNMTISSFKAYQSYAWGYAELAPISKEGYSRTDPNAFQGLTILDVMSTLWIMDLKEEWEEGKHWISALMPNLSDSDKMFKVREVIVDYLGGLLSAYFLSGETVFLQKAIEISVALKPAFYYRTGMLVIYYSPKGKLLTDNTSIENNKTITTSPSLVTPANHLFSSNNWLANIGFQQPELIAIANLTGDMTLQNHLAKNRHIMSHIEIFRGLYLENLDTSTGVWNTNWSALDGFSIDFFYNMLRSYIQLGSEHDNQQLLKMYAQAVDSLVSANLLRQTSENNKRRLYAQGFHTSENRFNKSSYNSFCLLSGMFALSSETFKKLNFTDKAKTHFQLAVDIIDTCHSVADRTKTKLLPYMFNNEEFVKTRTFNLRYLAEPYFILYRLTGDQKYRDWAWEQVLALYRHARTDSGGYSVILNVNSIPTPRYDNQPAGFLSGTLKYLYLIFSEPSVLPLDKWFFNTRGHPLPICGTSDRYTRKMCQL